MRADDILCDLDLAFRRASPLVKPPISTHAAVGDGDEQLAAERVDGALLRRALEDEVIDQLGEQHAPAEPFDGTKMANCMAVTPASARRCSYTRATARDALRSVV